MELNRQFPQRNFHSLDTSAFVVAHCSFPALVAANAGCASNPGAALGGSTGEGNRRGYVTGAHEPNAVKLQHLAGPFRDRQDGERVSLNGAPRQACKLLTSLGRPVSAATKQPPLCSKRAAAETS
jgi:hypothetical protein